MLPQLLRADYLIADPDGLERSVIRDGALVIKRGRVEAVGPWRELEGRYGHLIPLFAPENRLMMPGLVNAHHHGRSLDTRSVGMADKPLELWLPGFLLYPDVDPYWDTLLSAARMLRSGVTTSLQAHSHPGPFAVYERSVRRALSAYRDAGARVAFAMGMYDQNYLAHEEAVFLTSLPPPLREETGRYFDPEHVYISADDYFGLFETLLDEHRGDDKTNLLLSPVGLHWASDGLLERIARVAQGHGVGVHLHLLETRHQQGYAERTFGKAAPGVLQDFGLLGPHVSLAHAVWSTEEDLELYARTGATVVTNASSNLRLGSGRLPLPELLARGVDLAVGLDSMAPEDDMLRELALVPLLHRGPGLERWPTPYDMLKAATVGGAKAAGLAGRVGRLLRGYHADVAVLGLEPHRTPAQVDVVASALSAGRAEDVVTVLVGGEVVVREGAPKLNLDDAKAQLAEGLSEVRSFTEKREFLARLEPHLLAHYRDLSPAELP